MVYRSPLIEKEQMRIRSNMTTLDHATDLYRRFVAKLTTQEDNFDKSLQLIAQLRAELAEKKRELARLFPSSESDSDQSDPFGSVDPFGDDS